MDTARSARTSMDKGFILVAEQVTFNFSGFAYPTIVAEKTYLFRVPYYGFYIWFLKKIGLQGER